MPKVWQRSSLYPNGNSGHWERENRERGSSSGTKKWCCLMRGLRRIISCMKNIPPTSMKKHSGRQSKSVFRIRCLLNETRFRNRREENAGRNECLHRWHINRNQRCPRTGRKKSPMCCNRDWGNRSGRPFCSWRRLHRSGLGM